MRQYEDFLISGIPIAVIVMLIGRRIFRNPPFERSTQWIRIILLTQTAITLITFFYLTFLSKDENLLGGLNSQYSTAYIFMLLSNTLLPLLLLNKKLGKNLWVLVAFACKTSFLNNLQGYVSFFSKTRLIDHYIKSLGAFHFGGHLMVIMTESAQKLVDKYFKE